MDFTDLASKPSNIIFIFVVALVIKTLFSLLKKDEEQPKFKPKNFLLTKAEKVFFDFLDKNLDSNEFHIATKVRLADVFKCVSKGQVFYNGFNQIKSKHFDFLIISKRDSKILLAIELDDKSHNSPKAIKRDKFKNDISFETGLKLIRVPVSNRYDEKTLELFNI